MASVLTNQLKADLIGLLAGHTLKVALYNNSFTPAATNATYSTTNELATANGYTQGGATLTLSADGTTTRALKATASVWTATGAGFTAYHARVYDTSNSNHVVAEFDFGGARAASGGGTFTITWDTTGGILNIA